MNNLEVGAFIRLLCRGSRELIAQVILGITKYEIH